MAASREAVEAPKIVGRLRDGRPVVRNPDGSVSTHIEATVTDPRINDGQATNIPTMYGGRRVSAEEAQDIIARSGGVDPDTSQPLRAYASIDDAEVDYMLREHPQIDREASWVNEQAGQEQRRVRDENVAEAIRRGLIDEDPLAADARRRGLLKGRTPAEEAGLQARAAGGEGESAGDTAGTGEEPEEPGFIDRALQTVQNIGRVYPVAETAANLASQTYALPVAGWAGLGAMAGKALGVTEANPADVVAKVGDALTVKPFTTAGEQMTEAATYPFAKLAEGGNVVGENVADATGSPAAGALANAVSQVVVGDLAVRGPGAVADRVARRVEQVAPTPGAPLEMTPHGKQTKIAGNPTEVLAALKSADPTLDVALVRDGVLVMPEDVIKAQAAVDKINQQRATPPLADVPPETMLGPARDGVAQTVDQATTEPVGAEPYIGDDAPVPMAEAPRPPMDSPVRAVDDLPAEAVRRGLLTEEQAARVRAGEAIDPVELPLSGAEASARNRLDAITAKLEQRKALRAQRQAEAALAETADQALAMMERDALDAIDAPAGRPMADDALLAPDDPAPLLPAERAPHAPESMTMADWAAAEGERIGGVSHLRGIVESLAKDYVEQGPEGGRARLEDWAANARGDSGFADQVAMRGFIDELDAELRASAERYHSESGPAVTQSTMVDSPGRAGRDGASPLALEPKGRHYLVRGEPEAVIEAVRAVDPGIKGIRNRDGVVFMRGDAERARAALDQVNSQRANMMPGATYAGMIDDAKLPPAPPAARTSLLGKLWPNRAPSIEKPIRREDILRPFLKAMDARLYQGRVKGKGVLGFYLPRREAVRTKKHADLEVTAHEIAHLIDDRLFNGFGTQKGKPNTRPWQQGKHAKVYAAELRGLSYDASKVYEGFAEFVRHWMTNPDLARSRAPKFTKWFEGWVKTQPMGAAIHEAQAGMRSWFAQGNLAKMASKIGEPKPVNASLDTLMDEARQSVFDDLHGVMRMERDLRGELMPGGAYETARLTRGAHAVVEGAMTLGAPKVLADGSTRFEGKSLRDILKPVAGNLTEFGLYAVARSARELMYQGRERLFTKAEIDAGLRLETPAFRQAFDEYQAWNRAVVDFAQAKGLINPETRKLWARTEYLPFYRAGESGTAATGGMEGFVSPVKQLRGGTGNLKSVLGNMIQNASTLISEAIKNEARAKVAKLADEAHGGGKFLVRIGTDNAAVQVSKDQVRAFVEKMLGVSRNTLKPGGGAKAVPEELMLAVDQLTNSFLQQPDYLKFWMFKQAPKGSNLMAVMREGKPQFYEVADPILLRSIESLNRPGQHMVVRFMGAFRRVGQAAVTLTPDFIFKNIARDTLMGSIMSRAGFRPVLDSLKGMKSRITKDEAYREFVSNGGGFSSLLAHEDAFRTNLEKFYTDRGIDYRTVLDAPSKLLQAVEEIANAFEMSTRLGEFKRARAQGETPQHSAYLAREVSTDFGMRGDSQVIGFFYDTVPFLKAAANSMDRLYRGLAHDENRAAIAAKSGLLAMASMALYSINRGNPLYEDLENWDRDSHWHFYVPKSGVAENAPVGERYHHFRMPKIWEIGAVASLSERALQHLMDRDPEGLGKEMAGIVRGVFGMDYVPQILSPLYEQQLNRNRFTNRPIETEGMQDLQPWARVGMHTSRSLAALGEATRDMPEALQVNPVRTEALLRGYFKTWASYGLSLADGALFDDAPAKRIDEYPVIKAFYAAEPARGSKYTTQFYDLLREATQARRTMRAMVKQGRKDVASDLEKSEANARYKQLTKANERLTALRAEMRAVLESTATSPERKRQRLDELTAEANSLMKRVVQELEAKTP